MFGIIFGDSFYWQNKSGIHGQTNRPAIGRSNGSHRVATLMRKRNIDVEVVDFFNSWEDDELNSFIIKFTKIDFIGFGLGLSKLNTEKVNLLISRVKELHPGIKVIAGGPNVLENLYVGIDLFFNGFTEGAMDDIVEYLKTGNTEPLPVEIIDHGGTKSLVNCTHHYNITDLADLNIEYLDSDFIHPRETLTIEFSRGCIFKCKFCNFPLVGKNKNDYIREKEDIKQELIRNYNRWGTTKYFITDDTFNDNEIKVDMLYEIANELDFKLDLISYLRVDLLRAHAGSLDKLIKSGFRGFLCGIETFNDTTGKSINKGLTGDRLKNYLLDIKKQYPDLHINASFILGLPYESFETFNSNIDWALDNGVIDHYSFFPLGIFKDNKVQELSPFSKEWQNYGYEIISDSEFEEIKNSMSLADWAKTYYFFNENFKKSALLWKNEHMNLIQALDYAQACQDKAHKIGTRSGPASFGCSFNKYSLDDLLHKKQTDIDYEEHIKEITDFVNTYKVKKLTSNE